MSVAFHVLYVSRDLAQKLLIVIGNCDEKRRTIYVCGYTADLAADWDSLIVLTTIREAGLYTGQVWLGGLQ